jgi:hypothetical protein
MAIELFTPDQFGAVGDAMTNDTAALQALFDAAQGKTVLFGDNAKIYLVTSVIVRQGTQIIGSMCLQSDNTVGGNSSVISLEPDVAADEVILKIPDASILQRGISVGQGNKVKFISVLASQQAAATDDNLDGIIQLRGDDIWIGQIKSRNCDKPIFAYNCDRLKIGHVDIQNYVCGASFRNVRHLTIDSYFCQGLSPNSGHEPGHNAILMGSVQNAVVKGVIAEDAGEHGIRIGGPDAFQSEAITFVAPIIRRSGQCGFKANPGPGNTVTRLTVVAPMIVDSASRSTPGTNEDGIRLEAVQYARIISPTITKESNGVSGYDGIYLNDCFDIVIDSPRINSVGRHGINIEPITGIVNSVFINNASIAECGSTGVNIQGIGILRDITLMRSYIRLCGEYGVHCTTSGSTSGANQPVILDGWIKDTATGKLISKDPDIIDSLMLL